MTHLVQLVGGCQDGLTFECEPVAVRIANGETREVHAWDGEPEILRPDNTRLRRFVLAATEPTTKDGTVGEQYIPVDEHIAKRNLRWLKKELEEDQ